MSQNRRSRVNNATIARSFKEKRATLKARLHAFSRQDRNLWRMVHDLGEEA
jgi:hypothetical protein